MKNHIWRACRNSLPTKENLVCQTIIESPICDRCKLEPETTLHAFWICKELDVVQEDVSAQACREITSFMNFKELLLWLIKHHQNLELFPTTAWLIWSYRNRVRLNQPSCSPHQIAPLAKELLEEFNAVQSPLRVQICTTRRGVQPIHQSTKTNPTQSNPPGQVGFQALVGWVGLQNFF